MADKLELTHLKAKLERTFSQYPAGNHCEICAAEVGVTLKQAGFNVVIVTLQNEENPAQPGVRGQYIEALKPEGSPFWLGVTGFHQANRLLVNENFYYLDALVYLHYGVEAVDEATYFNLFKYSDGIEITEIKEVL